LKIVKQQCSRAPQALVVEPERTQETLSKRPAQCERDGRAGGPDVGPVPVVGFRAAVGDGPRADSDSRLGLHLVAEGSLGDQRQPGLAFDS
jgi:hypothetical protein